MKLGWVCAGESGPEVAEALDVLGMAGGFEDMISGGEGDTGESAWPMCLFSTFQLIPLFS
jgi:hypothetical protein